MIENNPTGVAAAFEILLEEIEAEIEFVNRIGAQAFEARDYDKAKETLEHVTELTRFRDKADTLRCEWGKLFARKEDKEGIHVKRRNPGRLRRGLRTREEDFYRPILQALQDLGGSAPMSQVLDRVFQIMKGKLREVDYEPLISDPEVPRWKNTAQWARNSMVKEGLLQSDSARGVWEISDAGAQFLRGTGDG